MGDYSTTLVGTFLQVSKGNHQSWPDQQSRITWKKVTQPTPGSSQSEAPTPEPDVLGKVDLSGYTKWDPEDQWEVWSILREYADIFTKDDLDLGQTSILKHKITLEEETRPVKECYRRVPPRLYDEVWTTFKKWSNVRAIRPSNSPWASAIVLVRKKNGKLHFVLTCKSWTPWQSKMPTASQEFRIPWIVYRELFGLPCST